MLCGKAQPGTDCGECPAINGGTDLLAAELERETVERRGVDAGWSVAQLSGDEGAR